MKWEHLKAGDRVKLLGLAYMAKDQTVTIFMQEGFPCYKLQTAMGQMVGNLCADSTLTGLEWKLIVKNKTSSILGDFFPGLRPKSSAKPKTKIRDIIPGDRMRINLGEGRHATGVVIEKYGDGMEVEVTIPAHLRDLYGSGNFKATFYDYDHVKWWVHTP